MHIPQLPRTLLPIALLLASDSLKSLSPVSWEATAALLAAIAVVGLAVAWRSSYGVVERTLWGLVAGWLMVDFVARALVWLWRGPSDSEPLLLAWHLGLEGATVVVALAFALYASRRIAYGGWFVIGLYIAREGARATASPGIAMDDLAFRLYVPLALLAYVLALLWAAVIASTFEGQPDEARRARVASLVGAALLVVAIRSGAFQYVTGFAEATWWWGIYADEALPDSLAKAVEFLVLGSAATAAYASLRWRGRTGTRQRPPPAGGVQE